MHCSRVSCAECNSYGVVSYADSLDCVGVLGRTVDIVRQVFSKTVWISPLIDLADRLDVVSGPDRRDMTCAASETREKARVAHSISTGPKSAKRLDGLRIGIPIQTHLPKPFIQLSRTLLQHLVSLGAELKAVDLPSLNYTLPAYYVLASAEASSNLARYGGGWFGGADERNAEAVKESGEERRRRIRSMGFGQEVKKRILAGTHALSAKSVRQYKTTEING